MTSNIDAITLQICSLGLVPNLSTDENLLNEFSIYPNPTSGSFNLRLGTTSTKDVDVMIYDMFGRKIRDYTFKSRGAFSENIDVQSMASGVYILSVVQGKRSLSKKLIIN